LSTRIAVIGPNEMLSRIIELASQLNEIEIDPYIYQEPQEATELVRNMKPCDVVFFSGALPYYFSKRYREQLPIPSVYLATDEVAIACSLLSVLNNKKVAPERLAIDLIDSSVVKNVWAEIESSNPPLHVLEYREMVEEEKFDLDKIVSFHQALWKQGSIDLALTSIHAVFDRLLSLGVPAMRITDPKISLIRGLQEAKSQAELFKSKAAQVAVGFLSAPILLEGLNEFAHVIHASVKQLNETLFVLYSTRGNIEVLLEKNGFHDFLDKWPEPAVVGFGYGSTITEAEGNAKVALSFAEKDGDARACYILTEEKDLLGPFPHQRKQQRLKNDHPEFLLVARQTRLSPANLSKIIEFGKTRQSIHFSAPDLADYLQVTRRSTERILKKLVDHGYVKMVGEEMTYQQGRPRSVYELNMPVYQ